MKAIRNALQTGSFVEGAESDGKSNQDITAEN